MTYKVALNHDNISGLTALTPQPAGRGILPSRVLYGLDRRAYDDGHYYINLEYTGTIIPVTYESLLTQFGLLTSRSAEITLAIPNETRTDWIAYNGYVEKPQATYRLGFFEGITFRVILETIEGDFHPADFNEDWFAVYHGE